jgi:hypothetical protein
MVGPDRRRANATEAARFDDARGNGPRITSTSPIGVVDWEQGFMLRERGMEMWWVMIFEEDQDFDAIERRANRHARWPADQLSKKLRNFRDRLGCFNFRKAFASICRIRSRVTENC